MDHEVIFIDDEYDQPQQQLALPGPSRGARRKRTYNGARRGQVQQRASSEMVFYEQPAPVIAEPVPVITEVAGLVNPTQFGSVIVDGQDVYFIQELGDENGQPSTEVDAPAEQEDEPEPLQNRILVPLYTADSDGDETASQTEVPGDPATDDYYHVDPLELSDIWNDLITANQEILILLELQDLKHHIVDARRIEDQLKNMTEQFECDSCDGKFTYYARYKDHLSGHTGQRHYQCDECSHQYAFRIGYLVHKILDHIKLNGIYVCPKCDLDCKNAQHYKLHIAQHIDFTSASPYEVGPGQSTATTRTKPALAVAPVVPTMPVPAVRTKKQNQTSAPAVAPLYSAKQNEQDKFLNVFESFSKNRITDFKPVYPNKRAKF